MGNASSSTSGETSDSISVETSDPSSEKVPETVWQACGPKMDDVKDSVADTVVKTVAITVGKMLFSWLTGAKDTSIADTGVKVGAGVASENVTKGFVKTGKCVVGHMSPKK